MKNCQVGESAIYSVFVYAHNPNFTQGGIYTYGYKPKSHYKLSVFDFMVVRQTIPRFFHSEDFAYPCSNKLHIAKTFNVV